MKKETIKIGYAPTRRDCFTHPEAGEFREKIKKTVSDWGAELVDIEGINDEGMLITPEDIPKAIKIFKDADVDGIFIAECNFGAESMVARVAAELKKPVLLWGPRDGMPVPGEDRTRDTQCGLFATGKVLRRFNVPFTYLVNSKLTDESFERGYKSFIAVCSVVKNFKKTRVLQISVRPEPFWTVMYNEGELLEKYGIQVFPVTLQDVRDYIDFLTNSDSADVKVAVADYHNRLNCAALTEDQLTSMARLQVAIKDLCKLHGCNSVAIHCWGPMQKLLGAASCTINGILTEQGIPVACETDIHGAITSILLQSAVLNTKSIYFADLPIRHPENDNAELLWHCGNFPPSLSASPDKCDIKPLCQDLGPMPSQSHWEIRHGDMTVCRFDGDHGEYQLMIGQGKGVDGPVTKGTYSWFEVNDWPLWEEHLVTGPYIHHCAGVHAKVAHILYEACKYLGIKADPISPTAEELQAYWRGN